MPCYTPLPSLSLVRLVALVATLSPLLMGVVDAHGYVSSPGSRAYMCKQGQAHNCGEIQYEPQSVEAPKGLPFARSSSGGGGGGKLCSAGLPQFAELDRQGANVWPTTKASDVHSFSWTFTAQHATTDFRYFITKPSWDAASAGGLSASDLETDPFLVVPMNGKAPPRTMNHDLAKNMPARSGHHVVYAVWTVDNTANAFYQCIDLDFGSGSANGSGGSSAPSTSSGGNTASAPPSSSAASNSNADATSSTGSSNAASSGSTSSSSSSSSSSSPTISSSSGSGGSANTPHKNHAANPAACRMQRRRRGASMLAARADYHRQKLQLQRRHPS